VVAARCDIIGRMPSPVGHALAGIAAGSLISRQPGWAVVATLALVGMAPDVDFLLPIQHRGPTHSIAAAVVASVVALGLLTWRGGSAPRLRFAAAIGAAYLSHTLLDWLGEDTWPPMGIMALWPFSGAYYVSGLDVFNAVDRRYWTLGFWTRNTIAVIREVAIVAPVALLSTYRSRARFFDPAGRRRPSA
jgi:hypothetical protein